MLKNLQNELARAGNEARALVKWLGKVRGTQCQEPIVLHDMSFPNGSALIAHAETLGASEKPERAVRHMRKCIALAIHRIKERLGEPSQKQSSFFRKHRIAV